MSGLKEEIKERRLSRMRQGQAVCEFVTLPSDPQIRFALVPLSEAEYEECLVAAESLRAENNVAGFSRRDRWYTRELLLRAIREPSNLETRVYESSEELMDTDRGGLHSTDVDFCIDVFNEMTANSNPKIDGIPPEEFDALKKVLEGIDWNALSGKSWYAARRFLGALITDGLLPANLHGSISISPSTTTNESEKSIDTA